MFVTTFILHSDLCLRSCFYIIKYTLSSMPDNFKIGSIDVEKKSKHSDDFIIKMASDGITAVDNF